MYSQQGHAIHGSGLAGGGVDFGLLGIGSRVEGERSEHRGARRLKAVAPVVVLVLVLAWAAASFFNAQWPRGGMGSYIDTPRFRWMVFARNYFGFDHAPQPDDWSLPQIIDTTAALGLQETQTTPSGPQGSTNPKPISDAPNDRLVTSAGITARPMLGVVVNLPYINPSNISLYARLLARKRGALPLINVDWLVNESARPRMSTCDYILVRTGLAEAEWVSPMERFAEQEIRSHPDRYVRVASFPIPLRNAEAVIYKCYH